MMGLRDAAIKNRRLAAFLGAKTGMPGEDWKRFKCAGKRARRRINNFHESSMT
jgi:hypothetical protein